MKNIVIFITLLSAVNVFAQDTIKYGDPQYLFNRRLNPLLSQNVNGAVIFAHIVDYDSINDTTGQPYSPIFSFITSGGASFGYHTNEPIRIYGIALNKFRRSEIPDIPEMVALLQYSNGTLKLLRAKESDDYTRKKLFMFEGYYKSARGDNYWDPDQHSAIFHGRETALSHCYEYFFDVPASVHDTFFVYVNITTNRFIPVGYNIENIPLYDSIGYPVTPDDQFAERYCDIDLSANIYITDFETDLYRPRSGLMGDNGKKWGMAFPIIMPLDGVDTLDPINPDSLWYYNPDSLGVMAALSEIGVSLAPNPASGTTTLVADELVSRLLMHSVGGRLVLDLSPNTDFVEIDLTGLPSGLYIVSAVTTRGSAHRKLLIR